MTITIKEAIKRLRQDIDNPGSVAIEDVNEAEELGIEALKRLKELRLLYFDPPRELLPGETK